MEQEGTEFTLLDIFNFWYGLKLIPTQSKRNENILTTTFSYSHLRKLWDEVWFAKKDKQIKMDKELKNFEPLVDFYKNYEPTQFYEHMAMIILYDQIPRNIFRKTEKAYLFDEIARKSSLKLIENIDNLPIQYRLTLLISLCHSENIDHQNFVRNYVKSIKDNKEFEQYKEILNVMSHISNNHYTRIANFGRIPERNAYVGRVNTDLENIFLSNLI